MLKGIGKKFVLFIIVLLACVSSFAQQYHFVYIQADNQQPFYVKYGGKNFSSTSIGYLILPKLSDGNLAIQVGFPKNLYPEQTFNLSIADKDYGYALKNFDTKGWGLFNFQTTDIVMNANAAAATTEAAAGQTTVTNNSNPFGNMLATAINDSTLNQEKVTKPTAEATPANTAKDTSAATASNGTSADSSNVVKKMDAQADNSTPDTKSSGVVNTNINKADSFAIANTPIADSAKSNIVKSSESKSSNGTNLTFLDNSGKDTIHAFIPSTDSINTEKKVAAADTVKAKIDNPFFDKSSTTSNSGNQTSSMDYAMDSIKSSVAKARVNSTCIRMFSDNDAEKLKKKIVSLSSQDAVLQAVRKSLRDKCISTDQVKDLGNLFLSDENRYNFYEAAYPFVYDYGIFPQLGAQLIDTYYKNRFKALLR